MGNGRRTGLVHTLVPKCSCYLKKNHRNDHMDVFTVPDWHVRWGFAAIGTLPVLGATVFVVVTQGASPAAVEQGLMNSTAHTILLFSILTIPVVLWVYVANLKMHSQLDYLIGSAKNISMWTGLITLLRAFPEIPR